MRERLRSALATTPGRYRAWGAALVVLLVLTAAVGAATGSALGGAAARLRADTGPVLVATQDVVASLAEADAAASSAFLSGSDEDPEARRSYEQALERASRQLEQVSSLIGDDERAHAALEDLNVLVTRYAGLVESARALASVGDDAADERLVQALDLLATDVSDRAAELTLATDERLADDVDAPTAGVATAGLLAAASVIALVAVQVALTHRTRRLLNPGLAVATLLVAAAGAWVVGGQARADADLDRARVAGYGSVALTAAIQVDGQRARTDETVALVTGDEDRLGSADAAAERLADGSITEADVEAARAGERIGVGGRLAEVAARADTDRERAAAAELLVRWQRYADAAAEVRRARDPAAAVALAVGPAASTFTGFNAAVESVLRDNRAQLLGGFEDADGHVRRLALVGGALPLLAALAALGGLRPRIAEYR